MLNLSSIFSVSALEYPEKTAVVFGKQKFTYKQIHAASNQIANSLIDAGIKKHDKIAVTCPNLPYFPIIYYGILKAGAVVVPLNVLLKSGEIAYHLKDSDAKAYFCFQGTLELPMLEQGYNGFKQVDTCKHFWAIMADPAAPSAIDGITTMGQLIAPQSDEFDTVQTNPDDTALILYTSGTTGFPKGAELSHSNIVTNTILTSDMLQLKESDIQAIALPLFHSFGQVVQMNSGFSRGNTLVLIPRFSPEAVLDAIENENATVFCGVPTMYCELLLYENKDAKYNLEKISNTLRLGISAAASLPMEVLKGIEEKYNIPVLEGYGLSETSPVATFNQLHKQRKPGSIGTPIWGVEVKIADNDDKELPAHQVGEIIIRGHNVMKGYYKKPEPTKKAFNASGWFHTGDLGKKDEDGYIYIVDRLKDMVIRGGFNVYPREIEEVLMTHPAVSLAAVIGVHDDKYGEEVKAFIVLKPGQNTTQDEIRKWAKENMAAYKYPRIIEIRDSLPMTATGKILKKNLKAENS